MNFIHFYSNRCLYFYNGCVGMIDMHIPNDYTSRENYTYDSKLIRSRLGMFGRKFLANR